MNRTSLIDEYIHFVEQKDIAYERAVDDSRAGHFYPSIGPPELVEKYERAKAKLEGFNHAILAGMGSEYLENLKEEALIVWNQRNRRKKLE